MAYHDLVNHPQQTGAKTLTEEWPYVYVLDGSKFNRYCSYCFKDRNGERVKRCTGCHFAYYCNEECRLKAVTDHEPECEYLNRLAPFIPNHLTRLMLRIIYKLRAANKGDKAETFNGRNFDDLRCPIEAVIQKKNLFQVFNESYKEIIELVEVKIDRMEALKIFAKVWTNMVVVTALDVPIIGHAIYLGCSALRHSCEPDAWRVFDGRKLILRTSKQNLQLSNDVTISYIAPIYSLKERQDYLANVHLLVCQCKKCTDSTWEKLIHSVKCRRCGGEALLSMESKTTMADCQNKVCNLKFDARPAVALMGDINIQGIRLGQKLSGSQLRWLMDTEQAITHVLSDFNVIAYQALSHLRDMYEQIKKTSHAMILCHFMLPFARLVSNGNEPFLTEFAHKMYQISLKNRNFQERQIIARQLLGQIRKSHGDNHWSTLMLTKEIEDNKILQPIKKRMGMLY